MAVRRDQDTVVASGWGAGAQEVIDRLPTIIGADDPFRASEATGPAAPVLKRVSGLRLGSTGDVHGSLVKAILEQVVTRPESMRSLRDLTRAYGSPAPGPRQIRVIPAPGVIAGLSYEDLHRCGIERKRAEVLIEVSRRSRRLNEILSMDRDDAYGRLLAIRGVGPWTAAGVMGESWGDRDAVQVGDYHLPNTVAWALAGEERGTDERMLELLAPYRPFRRHVMVALVQEHVHAPRRGPRTAPRTHL